MILNFNIGIFQLKEAIMPEVQKVGLDSIQFSKLLSGGITDSTSSKIEKLKSQLSSGKLSASQKSEVTAQISTLEAQEAKETEQKQNPLKGQSIFDVANQGQEKKSQQGFMA